MTRGAARADTAGIEGRASSGLRKKSSLEKGGEYVTREQLLPKEILAKLPKLGETAEEEDPIAQVKFFYPDFGWTWYGIEFDGENIFYGFVDGDFPEFGSFSLKELMENRGKLGCEIERDFSFTPTPASRLRKR